MLSPIRDLTIFAIHLHALSPLSDSLHAQALGSFGLTQTFSWLHEFAEHSCTSNFKSFLCSVRFPPFPVRYFFPRTGIFLVFTHAVSSTDL